MTGSGQVVDLIRIALTVAAICFLLGYILGRGPARDADLHLGATAAWATTALGWLS